MPSGWDVYYIVILAAGLALGIPASLALFSKLISPRPHRKEKGIFRWVNSPGARSPLLNKRINTRFFLAINVSLVLLAMMLALIPCVASIRDGEHPGMIARALILIVTIGVIAMLALLHAVKKNDLGWLRTFMKDR